MSVFVVLLFILISVIINYIIFNARQENNVEDLATAVAGDAGPRQALHETSGGGH